MAKKKATKKAAKKVAKKATKKKVAKKATKKAAKKATAKKTTKKATAKKATKKVAKKETAKKKTKRKPNAAFMKPLNPSEKLAAVVGDKPISRPDIIVAMWKYIKKNKLQEGRNIHADDKLQPLFGKSMITMFELAKIISKNVSS